MTTAAAVLRIDGDTGALEAHADGIGALGRDVEDLGEQVFGTWQELAPVHRAPEADRPLATMGPVRTTAASPGEDLWAVARALRRFTDDVRDVQAQAEVLRARARSSTSASARCRPSPTVLTYSCSLTSGPVSRPALPL